MDLKSMEAPGTYYEEEPLQLYVDLNPFDFVDGEEHLTVELNSQQFKETLCKKYEWMEYDADKNYVFCKYCKHSTYGQKIAILSHRLACVRLDFLHNHSISAMHDRSRKEALKRMRNSLIEANLDKKDESKFSYQNSHPAFNMKLNQFNEKRVHRRNYQPHWEITFPWLNFNAEKQIMSCKHCRDNPQLADLTSSFYHGSRVFRLDVIRKHSESQAHRRCANASEGSTNYNNTTTCPSIKNETLEYPILKKEISKYPIIRKQLGYPKYTAYSSMRPLHRPLKSPSRIRQRNRHYLNHWEQQFPWLHYKATENLMFCTLCLQFPDMCKETPFFHGSNSFRIDSLRKHEVCRAHLQAIFARDGPGDLNVQ